MFCPYCGAKLNEDEVFCHSCGKHTTSSGDTPIPQQSPTQTGGTFNQNIQFNSPAPRLKGSIGVGSVVGFLLLIILGWIPILGAIIAGLVAGLIARGALRGLAAGFISGIIGAVIIAILFSFIGGLIAGAIGSAIGFGVGGLLILLSVGGAILSGIGGLIGGLLRHREY